MKPVTYQQCKHCQRELDHVSGSLWVCRRCAATWYRNFHGKMIAVSELKMEVERGESSGQHSACPTLA